MLTISPSIRLAKSQDGGVLLDVDQGAMFSLNPVGARLIELLREGQDFPSLVEAIGREFRVSPDLARGDIADFLVKLREQHLLTGGDIGNGPERGDRR